MKKIVLAMVLAVALATIVNAGVPEFKAKLLANNPLDRLMPSGTVSFSSTFSQTKGGNTIELTMVGAGFLQEGSCPD
jgi:hypothetical protein